MSVRAVTPLVAKPSGRLTIFQSSRAISRGAVPRLPMVPARDSSSVGSPVRMTPEGVEVPVKPVEKED